MIRKMVEALPSSEEPDFNLEFYTQKDCQLSARAKYIISDTHGLLRPSHRPSLGELLENVHSKIQNESKKENS